MKIDQKLEIQLSKKKIALMLFGSLCFIAAGIWLSFYATPVGILSDMPIGVIAMICTLFFIVMFFLGLVKLFDKKPGMIISQEGIYNNTAVGNTSFIKWEDVIGFDIYQVKRTKMLLVFIDNPNEFIQQFGYLSRVVLKLAYRSYGTPLSIVSTSIKYNFEDMVKAIKHFHNEFKMSQNA